MLGMIVDEIKPLNSERLYPRNPAAAAPPQQGGCCGLLGMADQGGAAISSTYTDV